MRKRTTPSMITVGLVSLLVVACAQPADEDTFPGTGPRGSTPSGPVVSDDPAGVADRAVEDVTAYWDQTYPEVYGSEFVPVAGFFPYGPDTAPPPCGSPPPRYEEIAENAFYCPEADIIAWDEVALMPKLNEEFGAFTVAIVIAHEFGHAIQDRFVTFDRTVDLELQADCFAGAWTARVAAGDSDSFDPGEIDLDRTVAGMIAIRDQPGTSPDNPLAHGSGFDRIAAFQDGYENGARKCEEYADENVDRRTAEIPFDTSPDSTDIQTGGNFPLDDGPAAPDGEGLLTRLERDLNDFYDKLFTELGNEFVSVDDLVMVDPATDSIPCGGGTLSGADLERAAVYCEDENVVVLDRVGLVDQLNREIGDFAVASEVARLWALAAQVQLGVADGDQAQLQADCLTGRWAAWTFPTGTGSERTSESGELLMSAGDLDEGIQGVIFTEAVDEDQSVFDRTTALRTGFFGGFRECEEYGPLG
ncbi:MAG TPA: neutral zinc metallopeptidase [Acidimicrobiales bacterium]